MLLGDVIGYSKTYTSVASLPNTKNVYTLPEGDRLEVTGNLTVTNNQTLIISAGSQFIVNGNLTIEEKGTLQLSSNSKTVINGNLYQDGHSPLGWGIIKVDIGDIKATDATVVVTGDYDIWNGIEYGAGSYLDDGTGNDVYIYGSSDVSGLGNKSDFIAKYGTIDKLLNPTWPKCYDLVVDAGGFINVCTDSNGDINLNLTEAQYRNLGTFRIPNGMTIECRNFTISSVNQYGGTEVGLNTCLVCEGRIVCEKDFSISKLAYKNSNEPYFYTTCSSSISANTVNIGYVYNIQPFNGIWLTDKMTIQNGQGQDVDFPECSYVKSSEITINANISNGIIIEGHVVSDKITSTKDIYLKYNGTASENAILTLGSLEGYHTWDNVKIVAEQYTVVNLCGNPVEGDGTTWRNNYFDEPIGADRIGFFNGYVVYNYGTGGWPNVVNGKSWGPEDEWDINPQKDKYGGVPGGYAGYKAIDVIAGYSSYANCIAEVDLKKLLPIELVSFVYVNGVFDWETASETNNDYFVVEYSKNGKDWIECTNHVSSISSDGAQYTCLPNVNVENSVFSYFRLKQVDLDGKYSYSDIYTVYNSLNTSPCDSEEKVTIDGIQYRIYKGQLYYCEGDNE